MFILVHSTWVMSSSPSQIVKGPTDYKWIFTLPLLATTSILVFDQIVNFAWIQIDNFAKQRINFLCYCVWSSNTSKKVSTIMIFLS